jgi:hypothetical protein
MRLPIRATARRRSTITEDLLLGSPGLSARDAIHVALMERNGVSRIMTFDTGFDQVPGIRRPT